MTEKITGSNGLSEKNVELFVDRVYNAKNLGAYDLIDRDDPLQREELALGILSEFIAEARGLPLEKRLARAGIAALALEGASKSELKEKFDEARRDDYITKSTTPTNAPLDPATEGSKLLKRRLESGEVIESKPISTDYRAEAAERGMSEVDYSDTWEVVERLYTSGIISPGHAKSLLAYFGYAGQLTDRTKQFAVMARNDLRTRARIQPRSMMIDDRLNAVKDALNKHIYSDQMLGSPLTGDDQVGLGDLNRHIEALLHLEVPYGSTIDVRSHRQDRTAS